MANHLVELQKAVTSQAQSKALEMFYNETSHLVFAYSRKKGLTLQDGEDLVQIVYTQIYNKRSKYNSDYSPLAWLFVITKSETKDYLKKSATYTDYLKDYKIFTELSQNQSMSPSIEQDRPDLDLSKLNDKEKSALEQRYFAEKNFLEIAESLGVTETNVRKIISRAIQKMKG